MRCRRCQRVGADSPGAWGMPEVHGEGIRSERDAFGQECRKPRMIPSRDYDEQRLGILYSLLKSEYLR